MKTKTKHNRRTLCCGVLRTTLCGAGQVIFQQSPVTSLFFLAAIFWGAYSQGHPQVGWGALVGLISATLTGHVLNLNKEEGEQGLWGFNGLLTGCAFMSFLRPTLSVWAALILAAAMTTWVREGLNRLLKPARVSSFSMPFVLVSWLFLLAARAMEGLPAEGLATPALPATSMTMTAAHGTFWIFHGWLRGISQVFLIDSSFSGLLILLGLAYANGWSAFWAAVGSALALGVALLFGCGGSEVAQGLYGFSSVLTGVALGAIFYPPSWRSALWALVGVVATLFVQAAMNVALMPLGLPALTFPFCLTSWLFLLPMLRLSRERHADESAFSPRPDHTDWSLRRKPHLKRP